MGVGFGPAFGAELDVAVCDGVGGFLDVGVFEEPLHGDAGFDGDVGAFGEADVVFVFVDLDEEAEFLEFGDGFFAGDEAIEAVEVRAIGAVDVAVGGEGVDDFEVVAEADFEVRLVVGWGDLEGAGAEFEIDVVVGNDGDFGFWEGSDDLAADEVGVARVLGVDGHGDVAHEGFGAGG